MKREKLMPLCENLSLAFCRKLLVLSLLFLLLCPWTSYSKVIRLKKQGKIIPLKDLATSNPNTKKKIILMHNFYRARVSPPAGDMLEMTWHKGAEETAQKWANACQFLIHDKPLSRWVNDYGSCGQNLFVSSSPVDWMFVVKAWYMEHQNFTFGSRNNNLTAVGHYTQMIWYNSHRIGCGFRYCGKEVVRRPYYNYVCNYCPIGNDPKKLGKPYSIGKPCEKCKGHCKYRKLCTNSCPHSDFWVNCADLNLNFHSWLCGEKGSRRHKACLATCDCPNAIR